MSWQPIETAPKDGTPIFAYVPYVGIVQGVRWRLPYQWFGEGPIVAGWCVGSAPAPLRGAPTHWMPMPAPPSEGDTPTPTVVDTQATVSVEAYEQLRKEVTEMAQESVRRELALARLEAEVIALRSLLAEAPTDIKPDAI